MWEFAADSGSSWMSGALNLCLVMLLLTAKKNDHLVEKCVVTSSVLTSSTSVQPKPVVSRTRLLMILWLDFCGKKQLHCALKLGFLTLLNLNTV